MEQVPTVIIEPQLHDYPVEFINWECYAAKFMGAQRQPAPVAAPRLPQLTPRSDARVSYVTPSQTRQQRWYTPAQDWSEIRHVESSSDSEERRSRQRTPPPKQESARSQSKASSVDDSSELSAQVREAYSRMQNVLELRRLVKARGGERSQRDERVRHERKTETSECEKGSGRRESASHRRAVDGARTHLFERETVPVASKGRERKDNVRGRVSRVRKERVIDVTDSESEMSSYEERRKARSKKHNARKPRVCDETESDFPASVNLRRVKESDSSDSRSSVSVKAKVQTVKLLKGWGLKFSGEDKGEDPEEFLEQLQDCREGADVSDREILNTLSCVFSKRAARWYRTVKSDVKTWRQFARAFKNQFIGEYDHEDLLDDMRRRTQAKGEKITNYLASLKYIVSRFKEPPPRNSIVETAYRNLLPEYRRAMSDKLVETLSDIERYGRRWERQKELDNRYAPPPSADKMHVPGAAFSGAASKPKVAAVQDEVAATKVASEKEKKKKGKKEKASSQEKEKEAKKTSEAAGVQQKEQQAPIPAKIEAAQEAPRQTYAEVTRANSNFTQGAGFTPQSNWPPRTYGATRTFGAYERRPWGYQQGRGGHAQQTGRREYRSAPGERPLASRASPRGAFYGPCFVCQAVGHRASECPDVVCFACNKKGHVAKECPNGASKPAAVCQGCGAPGATVRDCSRCSVFWQNSGNAQAAGQK